MISRFSTQKILELIPRDARHLAVIGDRAAEVSGGFPPLNPDCKTSIYPNCKRFLSSLNGAGEPKFSSIVVMGLAENDPEFESQIQQIKKCLVNKGILLLALPNPFYFKNVVRRIGAGAELTLDLLKGLQSRHEDFAHRTTRKIKSSNMLIDFAFLEMDEAAKQWLNAEYAKSEDGKKAVLRRLKSNLGAELYLYRLTDVDAPQIRIQANILKPLGGVNDVRIHEPLQALATYPGVVSRASEREKPIQTHSNRLNKIFIFHRPILTTDRGLKMIQRLREEDYLIITEFDDHYSPWPAIEENKFLNFIGCHAVQTTTEPLADLFKPFNPEVGVFPNQLNRMPARDLRQPSETASIFFGALNREADWAPILPAINEMLETVKGDYHFNVVFDQKFFEALATDHKSFYPGCDYAAYLNIVRSSDIALLPLQDNLFNRMKSDLKLVEVAGSGAVPIASPVVYGQSDPGGAFTEFAVDGDAFAAKLKHLIEDAPYRHGRQIIGRNHVRQNRLLHQHVRSRYRWLMDVLERRDELDQKLEERLKAL